MRRIAELFRTPGKKLVPFITAGYPDKASTVPLILAAEQAGAHMIEIGIPFSDPLADGPVIQETSQVALEQGVTLAWILHTVTQVRKQSNGIPIVLMGYVNPLLRMGLENFLNAAQQAGVDGIIIPDLPPEEGTTFFGQARAMGISTIFLIAPNTPDERIAQLGKLGEDLLYAVSILGVTGSSAPAQQSLNRYLARIRANTEVPFVVGFGMSTPDDVRRAAALADGVVVGSALLTRLKHAQDPVAGATEYLTTLAAALPNTGAVERDGAGQ